MGKTDRQTDKQTDMDKRIDIQATIILLQYYYCYSIFVAFILEAFMLQYDSVISKFENAVNRKIHELGVGVGM
jgi:hypothetical protein